MTEHSLDETSPLLETIPDPEAIRARLSQLVREQHVLRSLLRVAERKAKATAKCRPSSQEGTHVH